MPRAIVLLIAVGLALNACAAKRPPSLTDEQREQLGRLGVAAAGAAPKADVAGPTPLGGVGGGVFGALKGIGISVVSGAGCLVTIGRLPELCISALMTPYWIGRGTVEGVLNAMPEGERRRALTAIETAIAAVDTQRVARALEKEAIHRARPVVIVPAEADPDAPAPDLDTVAEITVLRLALEERASAGEHWSKLSVPDVNPSFGVLAEARLRVVSRADQRVLLERTYVRRSGRTNRFADWGRDDAANLHTVRDQVLDDLASEVALEVFGALPTTTLSTPEGATEPREEELP